MSFCMYEYLEKNALWIILEISQNLTKEANGHISKYVLKISCFFGPKHMCLIVALYQSFEAEILNTLSK